MSFSYTVTDGSASVAGSATLDITPVNDAPTTTPVTLAAIAEDSGARVITQAQLLANASDIDGPSLTATNLTISAGNGTLVNNGNGTWSYTPALNDDTNVSFSYTVSDGSASVAGSATLDITPVNDAPTTTPVTLAAIAEDSGVRVITQAQLLANASDIDGPSLTATNLTISAGNGTLVNNNDGTWSYTPAANDDTNVSFSYTVTDGSASVAGSATLDITPVDDTPTIGSATVTVSEEALPGGISDSNGTSDNVSQSGTLAITHEGSVTVGVDISSLPALTSGGVAVTWSYGNNGSNHAVILGKAGANNVIEISLNGGNSAVAGNASNVGYTVTLLGPVDHPNTTSEDVLNLNVGVTISNGTESSSGTLTVKIEDDAPHATIISKTTGVETVFNANVMISLDISTSMDDASGISGLSRLTAAKQAIVTMLNDYKATLAAADSGNVLVNLSLFGTTNTQLSNGWVSLDAAITLIQTFVRPGGTQYTNYDAALQELIDSFNPAEYGANGPVTAVGTQNVSYFLSDGAPTKSNINPGTNNSYFSTDPSLGDGIQDGSAAGFNPNSINGMSDVGRANWEAFLVANKVVSYAIGMGSGVSATYLNPIAYNGATSTDDNTNLVKVVTNMNQLSTVLIGTTPQAEQLAGSLVTGSSATVGFGGDGGHVMTVTVDGTAYTYNLASDSISAIGSPTISGHTLSITTSLGGSFIIDMSTGGYSYTPSATAQPGVERIHFTLTDRDGDSDAGLLKIDVNSSTTVATNDSVITNILANSITVPAEALLANDIAAHGGTLSSSNLNLTTGWLPTTQPTVAVTSTRSTAATVSRDSFDLESSTQASLFVTGSLSGNSSNNNRSDVLTITLHAGETLQLASSSAVSFEYHTGTATAGNYSNVLNGLIANNTATDQDYQIRVTKTASGTGTVNYTLDLTLSGTGFDAGEFTSVVNGTYTATGSAGGSSTASVSLDYQAGSTLIGTDGNDTLLAANTATTLNGGLGNDVLHGGSAGDTLNGGAGNDILIGGAGDDILYGGLGADTFVWNAGHTGNDIIKDFTISGANSDTIDLRGLLQGENDGNIANFLRVVTTNSETTLQINSLGKFAEGASADVTIKLESDAGTPVDLSSYGSTSSQMIDSLVAQAIIKIDH